MSELGQLEKKHEEFARRNVRIIAVSTESVDLAKKTQEQFPHLRIAADPNFNLTKAVENIHEKASPSKEDVAAPTTLLIDGKGTVRWMFRPDRVIERLSPEELLQAVQEHL
jgi:peroxiredoxin